MNLLGVDIANTVILGTYVIIHGLIYIAFLFHYRDKKSNAFVGWSGKSWVLDRYFNQQQTRIIGKSLWIIVVLFFMITGLSIMDIITLDPISLVISSSILGFLAYFLCYNGIEPTPFHWILGPVINLILISYALFFWEHYNLLLLLLGIFTIYGMLFHTKLISS
jgi:hypothetical protein